MGVAWTSRCTSVGTMKENGRLVNLINASVLNAVNNFRRFMAPSWCPKDCATTFMDVINHLWCQRNCISGIETSVSPLYVQRDFFSWYHLTMDSSNILFGIRPCQTLSWIKHKPKPELSNNIKVSVSMKVWKFERKERKIRKNANENISSIFIILVFSSLNILLPFLCPS